MKYIVDMQLSRIDQYLLRKKNFENTKEKVYLNFIHSTKNDRVVKHVPLNQVLQDQK